MFSISAAMSQNLVLPKAWQGKSVSELMSMDEFVRFPFLIKDRTLNQVDPEFRRLSNEDALRIHEAAEVRYAKANGLRPIKHIIWNPNSNSDMTWIADGRRMHQIELRNGAVIVVSVSRWEKYVEVWVSAINNSKGELRFDLLPEGVALFQAQPTVAEIRAAPVTEITKAVRRGGGWKSVLPTIAGAYGLDSAARRNTQEKGEESVRVTGGGNEATASREYSREVTTQTQSTGYRIRENARRKAAGVEATYLKGTTVFPGEKTDGFVYFVGGDLPEVRRGIVRVKIGSSNFEFPFEIQ
jgi:hypothetical protein